MLTRRNISIIAALAAGLVVGCQAPSAHAQWTGCGVGAMGIVTSGLVTDGGPVGLGVIGPSAGGLIDCNYRTGAFVVGGEASYRIFMGDLDKIGLKSEYGATGRLGVLVSPTSLLYAHGGYFWNDSDFGNFNSWKIGLGNEFRVPNSPIYLDLRASYVTHDLGDIHPSLVQLDSNALEVMAAIKFRFGPGAFGGKGEVIDTTVPCDPKFANCKR